VKSKAKPSINGEIFLDYIRTVCLSNRPEFHILDEFSEKVAVLLMEDYWSRLINDVIDLLTEERVDVVTFLGHTIQIF
jgi:hypothetical protein